MLGVTGLSVTCAIALMTMGLLDLPADIGWAAMFLVPLVGFAMLLHRNQRGARINQRPVTVLMVLLVPVGIIVPRVEWDGIGVMGLAAVSLVFGIIVGVLTHNSYVVEQSTENSAVS